MAEALLNRVYDLKVAGYDDSLKKVKTLTKAFTDMDAAKRKLNGELQKKLSAGDTAAVKELSARIKELEASMKNLNKTRETSAKEAALQAKAEKDLAAAQLLTTKSMIAQERELDRLIAQEEKQGKKLKEQTGYYYDLLKAQKEAIQAYRTADPQSPFFENLKKNAIDAKARVDAFNRSLSPDGTLVGEYKTGILNAFKDLGLGDVIKQQGNDLKNEINKISQKNKELAEQYKTLGKSGGEAFDKIDKELKESIVIQQQMEANLQHINTAMAQTGSVGGQITGALKSEFAALKNNISQVVVGYVGFNAIINGTSSIIANTKKVSDAITEIEVNEGKAKGGADDLVAALRQIDTRTTLQGLLDISDVALKAGTTNENLAGVTEAIDKVKVAFGKDFGSIETGTETLIKLINIFFEDGQITGERILNIGNSIRTLANETTASVPFLTDFAGRMAGVKQIANVSLGDIVGLGAGFEQFKQSAEVSSTALVKIIPKLASDTKKYADLLGITETKYKELINANPVGVLVDVAEKLVKSGKGIEDVSAALADSELGSGRITTILSTLGGKADVFRERIARAGQTMKTSDGITDAFARKNTNLAGTLDKISKKFADISNSKGFQVTIEATSKAILFLISNIPVLLTLLGLMAAGWIAQNTALAILNVRIFLYTAASRGLQIVYGTLSVLQTAYTIGLGLLTGAYNIASAAAALFSRVIRATPLGLLLTVVGLVAASFTALGSAISGSTGELKRKAIQDKINADIEKRVIEQTGEQISKVQALTAVVKDNTASLDIRRRALEELRTIGGEYLKGLTLENAATAEGTRLLNEFIESLKLKAAYEAASAIQSEKIKKDSQLLLLEGKLQKRVSSGKDTDLGDLADDEKAFVGNARKNFAFTASVTDLFTGGSAAQEALTFIKAERATLAIELDETAKLVKQRYLELGAQFKAGPIVTTPPGGKPDDKNKPAGASRLTGEQKDLFKEIDANRDTLLAEQRKLFTELQIDEATYLRNVLRINTEAANAKLKLINGKNAEEKKVIAELKLYKVEQEADTNKQLFDFYNKRLNRQFDVQRQIAEDELNKVADNPLSTDLQKLQARQDYFNQMQALQVFANNRQIELEKQFGQSSEENAKKRSDALVAIAKELQKLDYEIAKAGYEERLRLAEDASTKQQNETRIRTADRAIGVLQNNKLSPQQQAKQLRQIELEETKLLLAQEVAEAKIALEEKEKALKKNLATEKEVSEAKKRLKLAELAVLKNASEQEQGFLQKLNNTFKNALANLTNFFKGIKQSDAEMKQSLNEALQAAATTVKSALDSAKQAYFDNRRQQIDDEKQAALDRLDLEQQQIENTAQSEAEKESIRRQFDVRRKEEERKASEEKKKVALKQAAIDFGLGVIKTLATYPFPFSLIPVAGLTVAYLLQRAQIQAQKFAGGGRAGNNPYSPVNIGSGPINNTPNIPVQPNGDNILATVKKGEVILNEKQQRRAGGAPFFRRLGVPGFATGGFTGLGDFKLGESLQAPYNPSSFLKTPSGVGSTDMADAMAMIVATNAAVQETSRQVRNLKVQVVAKEVQNTNDKTKKAESIGNI